MLQKVNESTQNVSLAELDDERSISIEDVTSVFGLLVAGFLEGDNHLAVRCAVAETKKDKVFAQGFDIPSIERYGPLGVFLTPHSSVQKIGHHRLSIRLELRKALLGFSEDFLSLDIKKAGVEVLKYGPIAIWYLVGFV